MLRKILFSAVIVLSILSSVNLNAHNPNRSIIYLKIYEASNITGEYHINVDELNEVFGLQLDKFFTVDDFVEHNDIIEKYLLSTTRFETKKGLHEIIFTDEFTTIRTVNGSFITMGFYLENSISIADNIEVTFKSFLKEDPLHLNYLTIWYNWKSGLINNEAMIALVFDEENPTKILTITDTSIWKGFKAMIKEGIWHIWIGIDHILFLLALILPSVVRRRDNTIFGWEPVRNFKTAFFYIIKVVTFFTIAHTITLTLASLQLISMPSWLVESIIAFSIGLAAFHNIKPIFRLKDWAIAFIFGLFHGFGFASVLSDLGLTNEFLTLSLLGFNIGVEIGQLVIIAAIFPILYIMRNLKLYPKFLIFMSVLLIIMSIYWFIERVFDIDLPADEYLRQKLYEFVISIWVLIR